MLLNRPIKTAFLTTGLLAAMCIAASAQKLQTKPPANTHETPAQFAARTQWWRDAKFGMFIHWGVYSVPADSSQGIAEWYYSNHTEKDPLTQAYNHIHLHLYV